MRQSKRGGVGVTQVLGALLALYIAFVVIVAIMNTSNGVPAGDAIANSFADVANGALKIFGPLFSILLGFDDVGAGANVNFLKLLTFILIAVIIVSILDLTNIFGAEGNKGDLVNLAIGIIVSIIGVRFMPSNLWTSLTTPASAFVATILVAIPFAALFFVTMKLKSNLGRKLMWIFYVVFLSYLIMSSDAISGGIIAVYWVFVGLAAIMMFFDRTVRGFVRKEKEGLELNKMLTGLTLKKKQRIRENIRDYNRIVADVDAPPADKAAARKKLVNLRVQYGEDLSAI